jgi:nucleotide-binding universal stress UspA family protein
LVKEVTIEHEILVCKGDPANEIRRLALKEKIDMVITATHGKSGITRLLIGSVTEKLMKTIHCPFLVMHTGQQSFIPRDEVQMELQKVMVRCDFSQDSKLAFDYGVSLAQEYKAKLYLTHVIKPTEHIELKRSDYINTIPGDYRAWRTSDYLEMQKKATEESQEKISKLCRRLERQLYFMVPEECRSWCSPHTIMLTGEPYKELIKYAKEQEIDMIVLGIRGHTLWEKLMVGSTTDRVIREAPCPVLAVRQMDGG